MFVARCRSFIVAFIALPFVFEHLQWGDVERSLVRMRARHVLTCLPQMKTSSTLWRRRCKLTAEVASQSPCCVESCFVKRGCARLLLSSTCLRDLAGWRRM